MKRCIYQNNYAVGYRGKVASTCIIQDKSISPTKDCRHCFRRVKPKTVWRCNQCKNFSPLKNNCTVPALFPPAFHLAFLCLSPLKSHK